MNGITNGIRSSQNLARILSGFAELDFPKGTVIDVRCENTEGAWTSVTIQIDDKVLYSGHIVTPVNKENEWADDTEYMQRVINNLLSLRNETLKEDANDVFEDKDPFEKE